MELSDRLRVILKGHLGWGKCRLDYFAGMLLALVRLKRMNLTQLALAFISHADPKSRYRRLQRFFGFRYGLDYLTNSLLQGLQKMEDRTNPYGHPNRPIPWPRTPELDNPIETPIFYIKHEKQTRYLC